MRLIDNLKEARRVRRHAQAARTTQDREIEERLGL